LYKSRVSLCENIIKIKNLIELREDNEIKEYIQRYLNKNFTKYFTTVEYLEGINKMDEKECKDINNKALEEIENIFKVIQYRININIYINECNKQTKDMDEDSINKFYDNDSFRSLVDNSKEILNNDSIRILVDNSNEILNNQYSVKIIEKIYHIIENFVYYKKLEQTNSNDFNLKKEIIS